MVSSRKIPLSSLVLLLTMAAVSVAANNTTEPYCMEIYRHDIMETWKIRSDSFLCTVAMPLDVVKGHFGIYASGNDFRFFADHELNTTLKESWSSVQNWDRAEKRIGARLDVGPRIHRRFFFQLTSDESKWGSRHYDWEDDAGPYTVLYVNHDDIVIKGSGAFIVMVVVFMAAYSLSIGAPLTDGHLLGIGAIGFPLFSSAAVFLHNARLSPTEAFFGYMGIFVASFGIAWLLLRWKREPFAGIVLSTLGALFYALSLEGESMTVFFIAVVAMLFIGLWIAHRHLDKNHHLTKQQIEAVALCACMLAVAMVLINETPMIVYERIFVDSYSPALPASAFGKMIIPVLLILPIHLIIAKKLEPDYTLDDVHADSSYSYAKEEIPA